MPCNANANGIFFLECNASSSSLFPQVYSIILNFSDAVWALSGQTIQMIQRCRTFCVFSSFPNLPTFRAFMQRSPTTNYHYQHQRQQQHQHQHCHDIDWSNWMQHQHQYDKRLVEGIGNVPRIVGSTETTKCLDDQDLDNDDEYDYHNAEAQKPKTFRIAAFTRKARDYTSRDIWKKRVILSRDVLKRA